MVGVVVLVVLVVLAFVPRRNRYIENVLLCEGELDPSTPRVFRVLRVVVFVLDRFPVFFD